MFGWITCPLPNCSEHTTRVGVAGLEPAASRLPDARACLCATPRNKGNWSRRSESNRLSQGCSLASSPLGVDVRWSLRESNPPQVRCQRASPPWYMRPRVMREEGIEPPTYAMTPVYSWVRPTNSQPLSRLFLANTPDGTRTRYDPFRRRMCLHWHLGGVHAASESNRASWDLESWARPSALRSRSALVPGAAGHGRQCVRARADDFGTGGGRTHKALRARPRSKRVPSPAVGLLFQA